MNLFHQFSKIIERWQALFGTRILCQKAHALVYLPTTGRPPQCHSCFCTPISSWSSILLIPPLLWIPPVSSQSRWWRTSGPDLDDGSIAYSIHSLPEVGKGQTRVRQSPVSCSWPSHRSRCAMRDSWQSGLQRVYVYSTSRTNRGWKKRKHFKSWS